MRGKTGMKKMAALLMSGILAFSFGTGALADSPETENIPVSDTVVKESMEESDSTESEALVRESVMENSEYRAESQPLAESDTVGESESSIQESQTSETWEYTMREGPLEDGTREGDGFSVDGDVLVIDDMSEGTFYRIRFDLGPGVEFSSLVWGSAYHLVQIILEDSSGNLSYWVRDHQCEYGCTANFEFDIAQGQAMQFSLSPASAGTVTRAPGIPVLEVSLNQPAALVVTTSENTVVTNDQGASFVISGENDGYYSAMSLFTDVMEGEAGEQAANIVIAQMGEGTQAIAYDIYLTALGERRQLLEGDTATVTLPVPQGWDAGDIAVYYVADDGTLTDMQAVPGADGTTVSFVTTHFSTYVMARKEHVHSFGPWMDSGDGNHQRSCGCGTVEKQAHTWDEGTVTVEATETAEGVRTYSCTVCGVEMTEKIPVLTPETDVPETSAPESQDSETSSETKAQTDASTAETQAADTNTPKTGDPMVPILWVGAMVLSAGAACVVISIKKRRTQKED